jgi:hypothetical protein
MIQIKYYPSDDTKYILFSFPGFWRSDHIKDKNYSLHLEYQV